MSRNETVRALYEKIEADGAVYRDFARAIWERPELGLEERFAAGRQVELLREWGFEVRAPYAGLETAFRAEWGEGDVSFAFVSEYDALPGIGHACGHNLICTVALAAANSLKTHMEEAGLRGRIIVLGTPAEEGESGKVMMERAGCLEGVDAAMMLHPTSERNTTDGGCLAREHAKVEFFGKTAHAGGSPEKGINALDAMVLFYNAVACWRQHIPEHARVHGVILKGGDRPNVIPDYTMADFYLRSELNNELPGMKARFDAMAEGAALMTGCTCKVEYSENATKARRPNAPMNMRYKAGMEALGQGVKVVTRAGRGSTDFGNFSVRRPGIHAYFAVSENAFAGHTVEMAEASDSEYAHANMLRAAAAMADIGLAYLSDAGFRAEVHADFDAAEAVG